jgi:cysteine-rich repeat protein
LVQHAHLVALDLIDRRCTSREAQALGFLLKFEAQTDMDVFCHQLEDALVSAVYRPVLTSPAVQTADHATSRCVQVMTGTTSMMLTYALHTRRSALDLLALRDRPPSDKQALLDRGTARIERRRGVLSAAVDAACSPADFSAVYGRSAGALLELIAQRADCFAGAVYVQTGVVCPPSVCGNGMQEAGEQCDDGNQTSGDGCSSSCMKEP